MDFVAPCGVTEDLVNRSWGRAISNKSYPHPVRNIYLVTLFPDCNFELRPLLATGCLASF